MDLVTNVVKNTSNYCNSRKILILCVAKRLIRRSLPAVGGADLSVYDGLIWEMSVNITGGGYYEK